MFGPLVLNKHQAFGVIKYMQRKISFSLNGPGNEVDEKQLLLMMLLQIIIN